MKKSEDINELAAALAKVQENLQPARKDSKNPFIGNKYADLGSVWEACRGLLASNGLAVIQTNAIAEGGVIVETTLAHTSGQWVTGEIFLPVGLEKGKSQAQVVGSAITYGRRYGLQAIIGVCAEDDDGEAAMGRGGSHPAARHEDPPTRQTEQPQSPTTGDLLTFDQARAEMDAQASVRDLAAWMNTNRKRLSQCQKPAMDHFNARMQALKKAA